MMRSYGAGFLAVLLLAFAARAQEQEGEKKEPPSPMVRFSQLMTEYQSAMNAFQAEYQAAKTVEERQQLMQQSYPRPEKYADAFLELAQQHPDDQAAVRALQWILSYAAATPAGEKAANILVEQAKADLTERDALNKLVFVAVRTRGPAARDAAQIVLDEAAKNPQDARVLNGLVGLASNTQGPIAEQAATLLLKVAEENKDDASIFDALAAIASRSGTPLADKVMQFLLDNYLDNEKLGMVCLRMMYSPSPQAQSILRAVVAKSSNATVKGQATYALAKNIMRGGTQEQNKEAEQLLASVVSDYGDVSVGRGTLGQMAEGDLFELQHLQIGMTAPEIEGEDIDGEQFKLTDYRGKVVVLDFWGDW
jgi:hypothetical protein